MKNSSYYYAVCISLLFASCTKEATNREGYEGEVKFNASYYQDAQTKADIPFALGNKSTIIGYQSGDPVSTSSPVSGTPLEATCSTGSVLTPQNSLYLPKGSYDFYSVSTNSASAPALTFASGTSGQLANEKDYLWSKVSGVNEGGTVNFVYAHKAVGLELNILEGSGINSLSVTLIEITPSKADASSTMNLATGAITPSSSTDEFKPMTVSGTKGKYIMLPLASKAINIKVTTNVTIGGTSVTGKVYTGTIPSQSYAGGSYYTLNLYVTANEMIFAGATVQDWTTQSISDITLIE